MLISAECNKFQSHTYYQIAFIFNTVKSLNLFRKKGKNVTVKCVQCKNNYQPLLRWHQGSAKTLDCFLSSSLPDSSSPVMQSNKQVVQQIASCKE